MGVRLGQPALLVVLAALLAACSASATAPTATGSSTAAPAQPALKAIRVAIMGDPPALSQRIVSAGGAGVPGTELIARMLHAGLSTTDPHGELHAELAESIPSIDNGLWQVSPDGDMVTTWSIRAGAQWQDGVPFSSDDLLFSAQVAQDPTVAVFKDIAYGSIASVEAPDPQTLVVHWSQPYINADALFDESEVLPRHLLGQVYNDDPAKLIDSAYWSQSFIGTGSYRLKEWNRGSYLMLVGQFPRL